MELIGGFCYLLCSGEVRVGRYTRTAKAPETWWLEDYLPFRKLIFSGYCWWFRNPANQLMWYISHDIQGFIHVRWLFGISSINSMLALGTVICIISYSFKWLHPTPKQPMETREIRVGLQFAKSKWPLSTKGASCPSLQINVPTQFLTQPPAIHAKTYKNPWNWYGMITYIWVLFFCKPYVLAVQKQAWLSWQSHITVHPTINSLRVLFQMCLQSFKIQWIIDMNLLPSGQKSGWKKSRMAINVISY